MIENINFSNEYEEKLYKFYVKLDELERIKSRIELLQDQVKEIEGDLRTTNVILQTDSNMGIDYSRDRVQSSNKSSPQENAVIAQIGRLEKELQQKNEEITSLKVLKRQLEIDTADMKYNIYESPQKLSDEARDFIEAKYKKKKSLRQIAAEQFQTKSTVDYTKKKLVENIAQWERINDE